MRSTDTTTNTHIATPEPGLLARPSLADLAVTDPQDDLRFARRAARYLDDVGVGRRQIGRALRRELDLSDTQAAAALAALPVAA